MLYTSIEHVDRKLSGTSGVLTLYCKNFTFIKLKIPGNEEATNVAASIEALSTLGTKNKICAVRFEKFYDINFLLMLKKTEREKRKEKY